MKEEGSESSPRFHNGELTGGGSNSTQKIEIIDGDLKLKPKLGGFRQRLQRKEKRKKGYYKI